MTDKPGQLFNSSVKKNCVGRDQIQGSTLLKGLTVTLRKTPAMV